MAELILSERQKPRVLTCLREIYQEHVNSSSCPDGAKCPTAVEIKRLIKRLEHEIEETKKHAASA
jgi:hypothetical protein